MLVLAARPDSGLMGDDAAYLIRDPPGTVIVRNETFYDNSAPEDSQVSQTISPDRRRSSKARARDSAAGPEKVPRNWISVSSGPSRSTILLPPARTWTFESMASSKAN